MANKRNTQEDPPATLEQPWSDSMPSAVEAPPEAPPEAEAPERLAPHAWGERLGLAQKADPARPWIEPHADWRFAAADKLHGWSEHAHNYQAPADALQLTETDFEAALEAAASYPETPAHRPACGKGFERRALTKEQLELEQAKAAEVTHG